MKKTLKHHIKKLEKRVQQLGQAMMQDGKTLEERNHLESELRVAQQANPGDDRNLGLWIDYELLRKHQGRPPQILIDDPVSPANNRYLELADLALGNGKPKKKSKGASSNTWLLHLLPLLAATLAFSDGALSPHLLLTDVIRSA